MIWFRPWCWVFGHVNFSWSGEGWSRTKFVCKVCGKNTGASCKRKDDPLG